MRTTKKWAVVAGALLATAAFVTPSIVIAYTTIGGNLGVATSGNGYQRDVRAFNNFQDAAANANQTPDPNFPGALGAPLAIWKSAAAWNSNNTLAAKNFDFDWQGAAPNGGSTNDNTVSSLGSACGGGVLAFTETPIADGWRMFFCEEWVWSDRPTGPMSGQIDLQGICTHELGHSLGLGHAQGGFCSGSCSIRSTMCPAVCTTGFSERSIATDDANGLQFIYGAIPADKPQITGLSGSFSQGGTLIITGVNFASTVNVKFTARTTQNTGSIPGAVYNVPSTGGGTQVSAVIPANAESGNVFVWEPVQNRLSNGFPIYINQTPPSITSISPTSGPVRGGDTVDVFGTNFLSNATVQFGSAAATIVSRTGSTQIRVQTPPGSSVGQVVDVTVSQPSGNATLTNAYTYTANPFEIRLVAVDARAGGQFTIQVSGPANGEYAMAGSDGGGPWQPLPSHPELVLDIGPRPPFMLRVYAKSFGNGTSPNLNPIGVATVTGTIPSSLPPLSHFYWQAAAPGATYTKTNQIVISIGQ